MANVLLINPSSKKILTNAGDRMPLGLLYIGTFLSERGHTVRVRDLDHYSEERLMWEVQNKHPDYIGVSCYTSPIYPQAVRLGKMFEKKAKTIVGGYHSTAMPETLTPYFDYVVTGEGEFALSQIVQGNTLPGIVDGVKANIDSIPNPDRSLLPTVDYNFQQDGRPATTMLSSRGCPNACVFCGNMNRRVRFHSTNHVIREVQEVKRMGYNDVYFYDDAFTINRKRTVELLEAIGKENISYRITTRAKSLDEGLIRMLRDTGCSWVSIGVESGCNDRLKDVGKNMTTVDNYRAVQMLARQGIKVKGFFMFGLPNESIDDARRTIEFAKLLKGEGLTSADFYIMTPFPGTPIWEHPERHGITITDRDFTKYLEAGKEKPKAFHRTKYMEEADIERMRNMAEEEWK